jgi:hypothetical protein
VLRTKIFVPMLSLTTFSKFLSLHALSYSVVALETVVPPPPPAMLDPGPGACHALSSAPEHTAASTPAPERATASTPASEHATAFLFLKPFVHCSWSLSSHHHRPRPHLPQSTPPTSSSSSPRHYWYEALNSFAIDDGG